MKTININQNCAYADKRSCKVLIGIENCKHNCSFFKTPTDRDKSIKKANTRLNSLPLSVQKDIADKYYGGDMPWQDGDGNDK